MMETTAPELHDAILLCAGVSAIYLIVAVLQLMQLKRNRPAITHAREPWVGRQLLPDTDTQSPDDPSFPHQLRQIGIEAGLKRLDIEVERLRTELQATRNELKLLRNERSSRSGAAFYNEAMSFAKSGFSANGIASRCGISMSEAELVAVLARDPKNCSLAKDELAQIPVESEKRHDGYRAAA
ncbi:MAG: DUF2802 domain-containing protein [Georgfuchsia sp.]